MPERDAERRRDLRRRLQRLGLVKGVTSLAPPRRPVAVESLVEGAFHETPQGQCFVAADTLSLTDRHGEFPLGDFLALSPQVVADVGGEPGRAGINLRRVAFLDTETTGLSGGTGTMAFMVGLGFFEEDGFRVLQVFLRDPGDEPALIHLLDDLLPQFEGLVSFNGRGFDVPILETRFVLARRPFPLAATPHLDLLGPARRLWRMRLPSCSLGTLEGEVLGVRRDQADVPGGEIPFIYRDYLRTGDAREIARVFYHNRVDVLSLVALAVRLAQVFDAPWQDPSLVGADFYALSRWYREAGGEAERALHRALRTGLSPELRRRALWDLALLLRQTGRRAEAVELWQQLAVESPTDVLAPTELAKTFEWHLPNLHLAAGWTRLALGRAERWTAGPQSEKALAALRHRLGRLRRKGSQDAGGRG
jgi:uncharacterized protein YprB with RNaseH-like and TPR domain